MGVLNITAYDKTYHIQLTGNYSDKEINDWITFLEDNQWKIYPLLANILKVFLPNPLYSILTGLYISNR